ncbi:MAG: ArsR/SmtB family transcription factor [Candidatus Limnocylindrales bacterium]
MPGVRVRGFSSGALGRVSVEFDVRTLYDFLFSLSEEAGSTDDLPAGDRAWLTQARADLNLELEGVGGLRAVEVAVSAAGLAIDRPEVSTAADLVEFVAGLDPHEVVRLVFSESMADPSMRECLEQALAGSASALEEFEGKVPADVRVTAEAVLRDPAGLVRQMLRILRAWLPRFQEVEPRVRTMIARDVTLRATDRRRLEPAALIERTTGGIRWLSEPGVRRVILAPSYFSRPYNNIFGGSGWRLFGYPIADAALDEVDPAAPPPDVVRLHRALGDATRLRILQLLSLRDWYLTEIAQNLELSKPTIKHHLALMRAAGLVTLTEEGGHSYYSLRRSTIGAVGNELQEYLGTH